MANGLRRLRESKGWTHEEAAERFGLSRSGYVKLERGERKLTDERIAKAVQIYGVQPSEVLGEVSLSQVAVNSTETPPFAGFVQAGTFLAVDEYFQQDHYDVPSDVVRRSEYSRVRQYAYQVRGDSLNAVGIEDGMWVVAADAGDFIDIYGDIESGSLVVVERTRSQGAERELTIKEIRYYRDHFELHPKSTNPEHKPIIISHSQAPEDDIEVKVVGVLLSATRVFRPHQR